MKLLAALSAFFISFIITANVYAETFEVFASGEYVLGDNDTKIEARRMALEYAKRMAAEKAGTYIESTTIVQDSMLTKDEIKSFTSAILNTTVLSEDFAVLGDKTFKLILKIKATADTSVLAERIADIKKDASRKDQVLLLQKQNKDLLTLIENLSKQLSTTNANELRVLLAERENMFSQIDKNNNAITVTLQRGTLLNLGMKSRNNVERGKLNIDRMLNIIKDSVVVSLGEPQVRDRGVKSDLFFDVTWKTDTQALDIIKPYFDAVFVPEYDEVISKYKIGVIFDRPNKWYDKLNLLALQRHLDRYAIYIYVNAGKYGDSYTVKEFRRDYIHTGTEKFKVEIDTADLDKINKLDVSVVLKKNGE